jgi:hypothetical protein
MMKFKKIILMLTVFTCVLAIAGLGFAANRVEVKVTSEPIPEGSACDKAGGFSLNFDAGTDLVNGDIITIDLDYTSGAKKTSLCRNIDMEISAGGSTNVWTTGTVTDASATPANSPVYMRNTVSGSVASVSGSGVYFRLIGNTGTQRLTLYVLGGTLTVGADTELVIEFLDQKTNASDFTNIPGIYKVGATAGVYTVPTTKSDNTLCIDVSLWTESKVKGSMDSKDDKFTFIPSDPQIAHIVAPVSYAAVACKTAQCGSIKLPTATTQGSTCSFDNESGLGYCTGTHKENYITFNGAFNSNEQYYITATIKVNGQAGDKGVYFTPGGIGAVSSAADIRCGTIFTPANNVPGAYAYYLANNTATTPSGSNACTVSAADKAVKMVTPAASIVAAGSTYLAIDLPAFTYDGSVVKEGDNVTVDIVLSKTPCGTVATTTHCIGTFGCATVTTAQTLVFPYFTQMGSDADSFWDGFVITNLSATPGKATLTVYEMDGDVATTSVNLTANGMYVGMLSAMLDGMTLTKSVDGTLGNSRAYIVACTDFTSDGFAMIGETETGLSMGYLPRNNQNVTSL